MCLLQKLTYNVSSFLYPTASNLFYKHFVSN